MMSLCMCVCVPYNMRPGEKKKRLRLISMEALAFINHLAELFLNQIVLQSYDSIK